MRSLWHGAAALGMAALAMLAGCAESEPAPGRFDMALIAEALDDCSSLTHRWWNPLVQEAGEALVAPNDDGTCMYRNRMTATFAVVCRFDEPTRRALAADFRRRDGVDDVKSSMSVRGGKVVATYEIDGETYPDTMTIAQNDGTCHGVSTKE